MFCFKGYHEYSLNGISMNSNCCCWYEVERPLTVEDIEVVHWFCRNVHRYNPYGDDEFTQITTTADSKDHHFTLFPHLLEKHSNEMIFFREFNRDVWILKQQMFSRSLHFVTDDSLNKLAGISAADVATITDIHNDAYPLKFNSGKINLKGT